MILIKLTKAQIAKLEAARPSGRASFVMGYAQRRGWPAGEHSRKPAETFRGTSAAETLKVPSTLKQGAPSAILMNSCSSEHQLTNNTMPAKKKFSKPLFERILSRFDAGQMTVPAIEAEGISTATFYRHLEKEPELRSLYSAARDARDIPALESEAYRRAVEGNLKPVYQGGVKVGEIREFSDSLLMFLLKARKPGVYAKPEVAVVNNNTVVNQKTEEQLESWRSRL